MNNYVRNGLKVFYNYVLALVIFGVFFYGFLALAGNNFWKITPLYSFLIFILVAFMIYSETKKTAIKEKKPQYDLHPYPFKGLIYGTAGFLPIAVLEVVSSFLNFGDGVANNLKHVAVNALMGPLYFILKLFGEKSIGYFIASLVIPVIAMLGYLAGYHGFELIKKIKKKDNKTEVRKFEKSPWNPTNKTGSAAVRKKNTKTKTL